MTLSIERDLSVCLSLSLFPPTSLPPPFLPSFCLLAALFVEIIYIKTLDMTTKNGTRTDSQVFHNSLPSFLVSLLVYCLF